MDADLNPDQPPSAWMNRHQVLAAYINLLGVHLTTLAEVAETADIGDRSLYRVRHKEDILWTAPLSRRIGSQPPPKWFTEIIGFMRVVRRAEPPRHLPAELLLKLCREHPELKDKIPRDL